MKKIIIILLFSIPNLFARECNNISEGIFRLADFDEVEHITERHGNYQLERS